MRAAPGHPHPKTQTKNQVYDCGFGSHGAHGLGNVGRVSEPKRLLHGLKDPQSGRCVCPHPSIWTVNIHEGAFESLKRTVQEGFGKSRRFSRDTYPESYITECTSVCEDYFQLFSIKKAARLRAFIREELFP